MNSDLNHLEKHIVKYVQSATEKDPERIYDVEVSYSDHCYKKRKYQATANPRIFDQQRYEMSKQLPQIISGLMGHWCYQTGKGNFLTINTASKQPYEIYFWVKKVDKKLFLHVESAYVRKPELEQYSPQTQKIIFDVILYKTWHNKPFQKSK